MTWRNDVKEFMNKIDNVVEVKPINIRMNIKDTDEYISVILDKPYLIYGITFVEVPKSYDNLKNKSLIHPLTNEELPLVFTNTENARCGIPAHNNNDYYLACENNLPIKQVIMPVNASLDENKPRDDKEWSYRQNVVLIVKHWHDDKYLYIDYNNQSWKCFISGGVEKDEKPIDAAKRELEEESGFYNIKTINEMPFKMANVFYAAHKGVNRYSTVTSFYIELADDSRKEMSIEEQKEHTVKWEEKEKLYEILKNGFTDQIWILKQHLGDIGAYTGNGKLINSEFLDNLEDFCEATKMVIDKLNVN